VANFEQPGCNAIVDPLDGQMHVLAFQRLCNYPVRSSKSALAQPLKERSRFRLFGLLASPLDDSNEPA
jgi:hypothetical protein